MRTRTLKVGTSAESGFTLIEFSVVVLILGLVFGLALARVPSQSASEPLRQSAQQLAEAIRRMRVHAISSGLLVRLRLRLPEGRWEVEGMNDEGGWDPLADFPLSRGELSPGVRLRKVGWKGRKEVVEGEAVLRFLPTGETESALLWLADEGNEERTLSVHPFLNRVEIHRGRLESLGR